MSGPSDTAVEAAKNAWRNLPGNEWQTRSPTPREIVEAAHDPGVERFRGQEEELAGDD